MELSSMVLMHSGLYCTSCGRHYLIAEDRCVICGGRMKPSRSQEKVGANGCEFSICNVQ
jgi:rRNA maturation endonuclease Nob1